MASGKQNQTWADEVGAGHDVGEVHRRGRGEDDWPHRELRLGFVDTQARLPETVELVFESGEQMVMHDMSARRQYWGPLP